MKNGRYILAMLGAITVLISLSSTGWSIENPSVRNPVGLSTVPPSSYSDGLVASPNPFDRTGNRMMVGNVRGGRSFHGGMPYQSSTRFWGSLSSTEPANLPRGRSLAPGNILMGPRPGVSSLNSFLRDSAGPEDFGSYAGKYGPRPFYSPKSSVSTTQPGQPGVFKPIDSRVHGRVPDVFGLEPLQKSEAPSAQKEALQSLYGAQPTPLSPDQISRLATGQKRVAPRTESVSAESYRKQLEQLRREMSKAGAEKPGLVGREDLLRLLPEPGKTRPGLGPKAGEEPPERRKALQPLERLLPVESEVEPAEAPGKAEPKRTGEYPQLTGRSRRALKGLLPEPGRTATGMMPKVGTDVSPSETEIEKLREQIAELQRRIRELSAAEPGKLDLGEPTLPQVGVSGVEELTGTTQTDLQAGPPGGLPGTGSSVPAGAEQDSELVPSDSATVSVVDQLNSLSAAEISARAKQIMGPHKSLEAFSEARFRQSMAEAQARLKQGKYYMAAGFFDQAHIFDSTKPEALAGKGLALFAAGEYVSSALYLARAIEMSEQYARSDVDLAAMLGQRDVLERRIADAEEWLERSCSAELEFLLAYIYYRTGMLEKAQKSIEAASKEMPGSKAVATLKKVIDAAGPASGGK